MTTSLTMKSWRRAEAERLGLSESAIAMRIARGKYPDLRTYHVNQRVVFVRQIPPADVVTWRLHPPMMAARKAQQ